MAFTLSYSSVESKNTKGVIVADFDSDGDLDYAVGNHDSAPPVENDVYRNDGGMAFTRMSNLGSSTQFGQFTSGDVDNDGDTDFFISNFGLISIYKNTGLFSYSVGYTYDYGMLVGLVRGSLTDVDNDGDLDIAVSSSNSLPQTVHINDGHGNFSIAASTFPSTTSAISKSTGTVPADFDSDGYVDLALAGVNVFSVMRGSGTGAFVSSFTQSPAGDAINDIISGDIDGDGDIDVLTLTTNGATYVLHPWFNNGAATNFTAGTTTNILSFPSSISLADIDNDGDLDALVGGGGGSQAYLNDGSGVFTANASALGAADGTLDVHVGDFDGDGDLDYVAGNDGGGSGKENRIYANDQAATLANTAPTAPSGLTVTKISDNGSTATIRLSWGSGSDSITPTKMLQYQPKVGTGTNSNNIVSGATASPNWVNRVMPNGQSRTYLLNNIPCNDTYFWNVATVDTGFMSTWGTETTFDLSGSCALTTGGGSSTPDTGGGLPAWFFHQTKKVPIPEEISNGIITVSAFTDLIRNGTQDEREITGFVGLSFTASGRTITGISVQKTQALDTYGATSFTLPPSDERGYWIFADTGSLLLKDFKPTTPTLTGSFVLQSNEEKSLFFGFVPDTLVRYVPCMDIGEPTSTPPSDTEAGKLLVRLEDSFGRPILRGISLTGSLIDRRNFFMALQRTQCLPLETNAEKLAATLRKNFAGKLVLPLLDLPIDLRSPDSALVYSFLSLGMNADRGTLAGPAADLFSPITRREAIQLIADVLSMTEDTLLSTGSLLPADLQPDDPLVPAYLTLKDLGILPEFYGTTLGPSQGITPTEASLLLARAAFRGGKITLLSTVLGPSNRQTLKPAAKTPTFLAKIPSFKVPSCLTATDKRAKEFSFTDILPGHPLFADVTKLLERGTENTDNRVLWLLTGTSRPTEYGIQRGTSKLNPQDHPSSLETIRSLLVLNCLTPDTPDEAKSKVFAGSLFSKVPRDMISGLPRESSFASRVLYKAQDHQKTFDLSLFSYAPELLLKEERAPAAALTLEEAASLLASALLRMTVVQDLMTPQAAEEHASSLRNAIASDLLGTEIDWTNERVLALTPFTREMLIHFLATVVERRLVTTPTVTVRQTSLGEYWWERVR